MIANSVNPSSVLRLGKIGSKSVTGLRLISAKYRTASSISFRGRSFASISPADHASHDLRVNIAIIARFMQDGNIARRFNNHG